MCREPADVTLWIKEHFKELTSKKVQGRSIEELNLEDPQEEENKDITMPKKIYMET